jgi:hypothetical protein
MQEMLCKDVTSHDETLCIPNRALLDHLIDAMSCFSPWVISCSLHFVQEVELENLVCS